MKDQRGHRARKRFGQNFLHDPGVIARIIEAIRPQRDDLLVEIGPGLGALTRPLLERLAHLHVVELDRDLVQRLRDEFPPARVTVHQADALDFDFCALARPDDTSDTRRVMRVVGNLPYNISTPLLFHLLENSPCVADMTFMLQKEVVDRLAAAPDSADYGRLSVMAQYRVAVDRLFNVGSGAFKPAPRVDSSVVRLVPHSQPPVEAGNPDALSRVVRAAFAHRRKTLRNNLSELFTTDRLVELGIDPQRRAETLSLQEFATLSRALAG